MRKQIFYSLLAFALCFSGNLYAKNTTIGSSSGEGFQKVAGAGAQFLKLGIGARASGLAGAYASLANDLTAIHWNPAGISDLKSMTVDFSYTQWIAGFSNNFAALSLPIGESYTAAVHIISFTSDNIEINTTNKPDGSSGNYRVGDMAVGATFGGYLTDQFSFGVTGRFVSNAFGSLSAEGLSFDIGTMYQTGIQGIKLGFSIHNLGTQMSYSGQDLKKAFKSYPSNFSASSDYQALAYPFSMPLVFRAGVSADVYKDEEHYLIGAADFVTLSDSPEQFALAAEYTWNNLLTARAGYRIGEDQFGFAGGFGINYVGGGFNGKIDYSASPTLDFGWVNRISISLGFGK